MYEKPKLNRIGDAQDVILGTALMGGDLDVTWIHDSDEFASDGDFEQA